MAVKNTKPFAVKGFNIATPKGKALWCKHLTPDRMYNEHGNLSTDLVCDPEDPAVQRFITRLEELRDIAYTETKETFGPAKGKTVKLRPVFTEELDKEDEPTGNIIFKAKLTNIDLREQKGDQHTITVVDAKKVPIKSPPLVGNGSTIRLSVFANPYYMGTSKEVGISLIWNKMQLIDLVEYSGDADEFDEEEGFEAGETVTESGADEDF